MLKKSCWRYCLLSISRGKYSDILQHVTRADKKRKKKCFVRKKETCQTNAKSRVDQKEKGRERECCRTEFGQGRQQKTKKIQDKCYAQESSYSLIAAVSEKHAEDKVISVFLVKWWKSRRKKEKRKKVCFLTQHSQSQEDPKFSTQ